MPTDTPLEYPFPYKTTDSTIPTGSGGGSTNPFIVTDLIVNGTSTQNGAVTVNNNETINGNLTVTGTITGGSSAPTTAPYITATDPTDQFRFTNTSGTYDLKAINSTTPSFNFKNSSDVTSSSTLNAESAKLSGTSAT